MASLLLPPPFACSLPYYCIRGQLHYKSNIFGRNISKPKMRLLNRNVSFVSKKSSHDVAEGSSDEESDVETSKTRKSALRRGRKKATVDTSEGETQEGQMNTEDASPEETKKVKKRGDKKAATTASSEDEKDKAKKNQRRGAEEKLKLLKY